MKKPAAIWRVLYWAFLVLQVLPFLFDLISGFQTNPVATSVPCVFAYLGVRLWQALHRGAVPITEVLDGDLNMGAVTRYSDRLLAGMNLFQTGIAVEVVLALVLGVNGVGELMQNLAMLAHFEKTGMGGQVMLAPLQIIIGLCALVVVLGAGAFVYLVKMRRSNKRLALQNAKA